MGLGSKLSNTFKGLGNKVQGGVKTLGNKIQATEKLAQKGIAKGIDLGQTALRKTEKGIEQASGKIGAVKQGFLQGARVLDALQSTGLGSVPGLGMGIGAVSTALRGSAAGLKKLQDVGADARLATGKAKNQLSTVGGKASAKVSNVAERVGAKVEKVGERAKMIEANAQDDIRNVRSAFRE
jgi:hypothetical protein